MDIKEIKLKIDKFIREEFGIDESDELSPDITLEDLGVDFMDVSLYIVDLEKEFNIKCNIDDINEKFAIRDIYNYVIKKINITTKPYYILFSGVEGQTEFSGTIFLKRYQGEPTDKQKEFCSVFRFRILSEEDKDKLKAKTTIIW